MKKRSVKPRPPRSELKIVEQTAEAVRIGQAVPVRLEVDHTRPIAQGSFSSEVLPFGLWLGVAGAAFFGGAVALLLYLNEHFTLLGRARPGLLGEAWPVALFAGVMAFGVGMAVGILLDREDYIERLWNEEKYASEFEAAPAPEVPQPPPAGDTHYVQLSESGGMERLPTEPRIGALAEFAQAVLLDQSTLTEAGAKQFGYGRKRWESLRDYLLGAGVILWIDPDSHQQGLELTPAGRRVFASLAANLVTPLPAPVGAS